MPFDELTVIDCVICDCYNYLEKIIKYSHGAAFTCVCVLRMQAAYDTWNHVAVSYDGSKVEMYINNALVATTALSGQLYSYSVIAFKRQDYKIAVTIISHYESMICH